MPLPQFADSSSAGMTGTLPQPPVPLPPPPPPPPPVLPVALGSDALQPAKAEPKIRITTEPKQDRTLFMVYRLSDARVFEASFPWTKMRSFEGRDHGIGWLVALPSQAAKAMFRIAFTPSKFTCDESLADRRPRPAITSRLEGSIICRERGCSWRGAAPLRQKARGGIPFARSRACGSRSFCRRAPAASRRAFPRVRVAEGRSALVVVDPRVCVRGLPAAAPRQRASCNGGPARIRGLRADTLLSPGQWGQWLSAVSPTTTR